MIIRFGISHQVFNAGITVAEKQISIDVRFTITIRAVDYARSIALFAVDLARSVAFFALHIVPAVKTFFLSGPIAV